MTSRQTVKSWALTKACAYLRRSASIGAGVSKLSTSGLDRRVVCPGESRHRRSFVKPPLREFSRDPFAQNEFLNLRARHRPFVDEATVAGYLVTRDLADAEPDQL